MKKAARAAIRAAVAAAVLKGVAFLVSRAFEGDTTASDDDFKLLAIIDGRQLKSEASALRTGSATTLMGGIDIDLTQATLDPGGAHITLKAVMGGIQLTVPTGWRVDVDIDERAAGVEVETPDPANSPEGAPRLLVEAYARMGGILIRESK